MPSFFSGAPKETPSSDFSTTNAEMPLAPLLGVGDRHAPCSTPTDAGVGDPALHAVEDPVVAVAHGPGLHADGVGAGVGLGEAVGEAALAGGELAEVLLLQLLRPGDLHRQRAELVDRRDQRCSTRRPGRPPRSRARWPARPRRRRRTPRARAGRGSRRPAARRPPPAGSGRSRRRRRRTAPPWRRTRARTASRIAWCSSERAYSGKSESCPDRTAGSPAVRARTRRR